MFEHYIAIILQYIRLHPHVGELFAFVISLSESLPLIGTVIPGSVTMTALGTLIGSLVLPGFTTMACAVLGAFIGDLFGFFLGRHYKENIRLMWPFRKHPQWLTWGEDFFKRHGGKGIILGRFVGPMRSTVPLIAGLLKVSKLRFFSAAIPSAILWAILYTLPGIILGALSLDLPRSYTAKFLGAGIVLIIVAWALLWLLKTLFFRLQRGYRIMIKATWRSFCKRPQLPSWARCIQSQSQTLSSHAFTLSIFSALCLLFFIILFYGVIQHSYITRANQPVFFLLQSLHSPGLYHFFIAITLLGSKPVIGVIVVLSALWFASHKKWRAFWHLIIGTLITFALILFCKHVYHSSRPTGLVGFDPSSSFPSGHAGSALFIYGFLIFLIAHQKHKKWLHLRYTLATVLIFLVGFSRIFLGAHWLTDIIGSFLLGTGVLFAIIVSYQRKKTEVLKVEFSLFVSLTLLVTWLAYGYFAAPKLLLHYQSDYPKITVSMPQWWKKPQNYLPIYRKNRLGHMTDPFNIQWAAPLTNIQRYLQQRGWRVIYNRYSVKSILNRFVSRKPQLHLPLLPRIHQDHRPTLIMFNPVAQSKKVMELRLWPTNVSFIKYPAPLWIGTLSYHIPPEKLFTLKKSEFSYYTINDITKHFEPLLKKNTCRVEVIDIIKPKTIRALNWHGNILLIKESPS